MSIDFNVNQIPYRFFGDKLISTDKSNNLIIESSSNNIELKSNTKNFIFNNNIIFNYGLNLNDIDLSNIHSISAKTLNTDTLFLRNKERSQTSIEDTESIENGYIRATTIGNTISGSSNAYFTYINVSGGDSSFNNSVYIKDRLTVNGTTSISNDLIVNGKSFVTLYNAINNYIVNNSQQLVSAKIVTNDLSATNISISNDLIVGKTSIINDLTISGQMLNNVLKVPSVFTIDPSGHGNASGTLIINGDLMVYGNNTIIASSNVEISDVAISVATNLNNKNDLIGNSTGLDISNVASLKYNGTLWNFSGGQVSVENKRVALDVSFIEFRSYSEASLASLNSDIDLSFGQLKNNIDNSYNAIYSRNQIDNSFLLITTFDLSKQSFESSIDNSYVTKLAFDGSFSTLKTYLDASYIIKSTSTNLNIIDSSLLLLNNRVDSSYVSNSVFEGSFNNLKNQIDNSFASITITSLNTSSISVETINTKHHSQRFSTSSWNQFGQDISSGLSLTNNNINNNNKLAISNDGKVVAFASSPVLRNASGGAITISGGFVIHRFDTSGTFSSTFNGPVEVLIVGGGGGGGFNIGGGGGGGGVIYMPAVYVTSGTNYSVVVGAGGAPDTNGQNSTAFNAIAAGGGRGGTFDSNGFAGGSGGGAGSASTDSTLGIGGESSGNSLGPNSGFTYGNRGGNMTTPRASTGGDPGTRAAGGGGAGAQGLDTNCNILGNTGQTGAGSGGVGVVNAILGPSYYWGGGGGGLGYTDQSGGWGGLGGGGGGAGRSGGGIGGGLALNTGISGGSFTNTNGGAGGANTGGGGGGGGGGHGPGNAGRGGSGIVVIRYLQLQTVSGSLLNLSSWQSDISRGRVYVYELSYNQASSRWNQLGLSSEIIVGASNEDQFGWDIALSSNGRVVAASSIANDASGTNSGQVRLFELSNNNNRWIKKGSDINGPRPGSESGYSISLAGSGNSIAIGAWKDNLNGTNAGAVRVYDFSASINDWRQKGQTINGVSGSFEGYSTALSLDGLTLASSSIGSGSSINSSGNITSYNEYIVHSFTNVGITVFTVINPITIDYLVVAGGGSGGVGRGGGGGGAGGVLSGKTTLMPGSYNITVGVGGPSITTNTKGNNGGSSSIGNLIIAIGGGGGGGSEGSNESIGQNGGSGGGSCAATGTRSVGILEQGFAGSGNLDIYTGGGGGGAGAAALGKDGAIGITSTLTGTIQYYAGGGGGGAYLDHGVIGIAYGGSLGTARGLYGGGNGSNKSTKQPFQDAQPNTGGGGGGLFSGGTSGAGGSGIVIIRYIKSSIVKTFAWSGTTWEDKGIIQGPSISNFNFGKSIKLSANGNTIIVGEPGYANEYPITPIYELNSTITTWLNHRTNALTVYGRDLAVILDAQQNTRAEAIQNNTRAFIGGKRKSGSSATGKTAADWEWVTGDMWNFHSFLSFQPDNISENVLHFYDGAWNDIGADSVYPAIYMYYKARSLNVGQAYVYRYQGVTTWTQLGQIIQGISGGNEFGSSVNISNDGTIISVGTNDIFSNSGYVNVYKYVNNYWAQISNTLNGKVATFKAGLHALNGDGTTLIQSNANYYSVYGINKLLALNSPVTTISGNLIVIGNMSVNSLDISGNHSYSSNGYSSKMFNSNLSSAIMKDYYSNVTSTKDLKVQIYGNGDIKNKNNSFSSLSDSRLKENIVTSGPKLEDLLKVRVVNYNLKGSNSTNYIGVLAQELEELFPNLVTEIEPSPKDVQEGRTIRYKAVNYSSFDSILIKALQEQNAMLKNITQNIEALEAALEDE